MQIATTSTDLTQEFEASFSAALTASILVQLGLEEQGSSLRQPSGSLRDRFGLSADEEDAAQLTDDEIDHQDGPKVVISSAAVVVVSESIYRAMHCG